MSLAAPSSSSVMDIRTIPKAELHLHIEGTLEPEMALALAERNGITLAYKTAEEMMRKAYQFDSLTSFLEVYYASMAVLLTEQDFYDLGVAYFERAHQDGVVYAEVFFDPQAHTSRGVSFEAVITGLRVAQMHAADRLGIESQLIMCILRDHPVESAFETLAQAEPWRDWIVGVGLDSDEHGNPPEKFQAVFEAARSQGYRTTMHCDVDQEDAIGHIRQCLDMGIERIDHGINALEDDAVEEIRRRGIGLTVCPISNAFVTGSFKSREIRALLERGVLVTVNSDDPGYFGGYIADNLSALDLTQDELVRVVRNGFQVSWLDERTKQGYLDQVDRWVQTHEGGQDDVR